MKRITNQQLAAAVNKYFKSVNLPIQYTVLGRTILYVDYSIPKEWTNKREYGYAPVYISKTTRGALQFEYEQRIIKQRPGV